MRKIIISDECFSFINELDHRTNTKFYYVLKIICGIKHANSKFVKKITGSKFYELRIKSENEVRIILFCIDHENFYECKKAICLNGFIKKSTKDYIKAIKSAEKILDNSDY